MSVFKRLAGAMTAFFQVGGPKGPGWDNNAGVLEAKDPTNTTFAVVRGVTPTVASPNDFVTAGSGFVPFAQGQTTLTNGGAIVPLPNILATARIVFGRSATNGSTALGTPSVDPVDITPGPGGSFAITSLTANNAAETNDNATYSWILFQ